MNAGRPWTARVLTLFPEMFPGPLGHSLAGKALASGLVDEIYEGDPAAAGVAFVKKAVAAKRPLTLARDRNDKIDAFKAGGDFDALVAKSSKRGVGGTSQP